MRRLGRWLLRALALALGAFLTRVGQVYAHELRRRARRGELAQVHRIYPYRRPRW